MKILIRSRKAIEKMSKSPFQKGTAIISITDANDSPVNFENEPDFLLRLAFDDVDNDVFADEPVEEPTDEERLEVEKKYNMFSEEQANEINPQIIAKSGMYETEEGCLSLLGGLRKCKRYKTIKVQFQTLELRTHVKNYTGWTAQIIQHEIDHCNGILI